MKITDYCPRAAPFDSFIKGDNLIGIEIGTDVGAHAEALLMYCDIKKLYLVDIWDNNYMYGYCQGRLRWYANKIEYINKDSHKAALQGYPLFDFIYIDIPHDYDTVKQSLEDWWFKLKSGGILGYRNYAPTNLELMRAVDEFIKYNNIEVVDIIQGDIIMKKS